LVESSDPIRFVSLRFETVSRLSQFVTHLFRSPSSGPSGSSLPIPLIVRVTGAMVTTGRTRAAPCGSRPPRVAGRAARGVGPSTDLPVATPASSPLGPGLEAQRLPGCVLLEIVRDPPAISPRGNRGAPPLLLDLLLRNGQAHNPSTPLEQGVH
jgi:hypothetical protein